MNSIQTITQTQIEKISTVKEAAQIKQMADSAAIFYQAQDDLVASQHAKEISLRSARQAGVILLNTPKENGGDRKSKQAHARLDLTPYREALDGAGITAYISQTWQRLAVIPQILFEEYVHNAKYANTEFTINGLIEFARPFFRAQKAQEQDERAAGYEAKEYNGFKVNDVYVGDVHKIELPENSVDMIFTDPPYHDEHLELYKALADFAFHSLKPGAYLMTYAGKMFLPDVMKMLGERLEYVWMYGVFQPDSNTKIIRHHLFGAWRPIVCYKRPGKTNTKAWQPDMIKGTRDKSFHEWQQQIEPPIKYIGAYTLPGELVVDPFVGGGTTLAACKMLKRDYLGFDKDAKAVKITKMRLNEKELA